MTALVWVLLYLAIGLTINLLIVSENGKGSFSPVLVAFWPLAVAMGIIVIFVVIVGVAWEAAKKEGRK